MRRFWVCNVEPVNAPIRGLRKWAHTPDRGPQSHSRDGGGKQSIEYCKGGPRFRGMTLMKAGAEISRWFPHFPRTSQARCINRPQGLPAKPEGYPTTGSVEAFSAWHPNCQLMIKSNKRSPANGRWRRDDSYGLSKTRHKGL